MSQSNLDFQQIFQRAFDEVSNRIKVDAELTSTIIAPPGLEVAIEDTDDSIKIGNGSGVYAQVTGANALKVDGSAVTQPISAVTLPLPAGASTSALQITGNTSLSSIDSKLTSPLAVSQSGTWNINNISGVISLPTGASTSANQSTANASLSSIDSKLTSPLSVTVGNFPAIQTVSVNNFPATQAVTQSTSPWVIDGSGVIQPVSGTINVVQSGTWDINSIVNPITLNFQTGSDVFTTTGNGSTINASSNPLKSYSLQVVISGTVTVWDVRLEGSLDNVNFTQILQHTNVTGDGITVFSGSPLSPCTYIRTRCTGFTGLGGSSLTALVLGIE